MTTTQIQPATTGYRRDLDGLRGVAIALVVIFHIFVGRVSGGVDVFLLLSGYFFLGSQLRYAARPSASLNPWWPLWRVIRRLVPALALTLAATVLGVVFVVPQLLNEEFTRQVTASVGYFLNWELINQEAAYAAASVDTSPLQHLWSMAVQGQFYLFAILFALGFAFIYRRGGPAWLRPGPVLLAITAVSFLWAARHGLVGTPESYYSIFSRAWELSLGAVLAIYRDRLRLPREMAPAAGVFGLVLIVITGIIIPETLMFPGPAALIPLGGAALIILSGRGPATTALSAPFARWLGGIAYALYLWHWPLLIIATALIDTQTPPFWLGVIVVAVSLVLADLTHRYVESPLRQHRRRPTRDDDPVTTAQRSLDTIPGRARAAGGAGVAAVMVALLAVQPVYSALANRAAESVVNNPQYPGAMALAGAEAPDVEPRPDPSLAPGIYPSPGEDGCIVYKDQPADFFVAENDDDNPCIYGDPDGESVVVIAGGSHAEPWTEALNALGREHGFQVIPFLRQECPVVLGENFWVSPECAQWSELAVARIVDLAPDAVVSTSTRPQGPIGEGPDFVPGGYGEFWAALDGAGISFVGLRDNPWFFDSTGAPLEPNVCLVEDDAGCAMDRQAVYAPEDPAAALMAPLANAHAIDTSDWFCNADECPAVIGNVTAYRDQNHISNAYALSAAPLLWEHLEPVI